LGIKILNFKVFKFVLLVKGLRRARAVLILVDKGDAGEITLGVDKIHFAPGPVWEAKGR
jgi:hypothetical protein